MSLSSREVKELLALLEESNWDEAQITFGDVTLAVSKADGPGLLANPPAAAPPAAAAPAPAAAAPATPDAPAPASAAAAPSPISGTEPSGHVVTAPSVGSFWRAPEPGAPPFVEVGDEVAEGQTLCIVEVMKLMQHVTSEVAGKIVAIHIENSEHVEFGTPLFSIEPTG